MWVKWKNFGYVLVTFQSELSSYTVLQFPLFAVAFPLSQFLPPEMNVAGSEALCKIVTRRSYGMSPRFFYSCVWPDLLVMCSFLLMSISSRVQFYSSYCRWTSSSSPELGFCDWCFCDHFHLIVCSYLRVELLPGDMDIMLT